MEQWELLHLPVHVFPPKGFTKQPKTNCHQWVKEIAQIQRTYQDTGKRVNWGLTYKLCLGNTTGVSQFMWKLLSWVLSRYVNFLKTMNKKKKDQKRLHLLWIWEAVLLSKERNLTKFRKQSKTQKISGLTAHFLYFRLQCLSKVQVADTKELVQTVG